jgi:hypothetical protein
MPDASPSRLPGEPDRAELDPPPTTLSDATMSAMDGPAIQTFTPAAAMDRTAADEKDFSVPWWWVTLFVIVFLLFAGVVVVLVALHQNLLVAVGVPATLSGAALVVVHRLVVLSRRRQGR